MSGDPNAAEPVVFDLKTSEEIVALRTSMDNLMAVMRDHEKMLRDGIRVLGGLGLTKDQLDMARREAGGAS